MSIKFRNTRTVLALTILALGASGAPLSQAFDFGDMMNPSRWMNGNDRNDETYPDERYSDAPPPGYGYGPGVPAPGFAPPPPGYAAPGYYGGVPAPAPAAPAAQNADQAEIDALKRRIEELEARQPPEQSSSQPSPAGEWPAAPAFRPTNQY